MDDLDLSDDGMVALIKYWFGIFLDQWLWEDDNIDCWEGTMTTSECRILINHLLVKAWSKAFEDTCALWNHF